MKNETWKAIDNQYEASDLGRIRRSAAGVRTYVGRIVKPRNTRQGYKTAYLHRKSYRIHRLVATVFLGEKPGMQVNHINGKKGDNRLCNLEWLTRADNMKHAGESRLMPLGTLHYMCRFTEEHVADMRDLRRKGMMLCEIAKLYGAHPSYVGRICSMKIRRRAA